MTFDHRQLVGGTGARLGAILHGKWQMPWLAADWYHSLGHTRVPEDISCLSNWRRLVSGQRGNRGKAARFYLDILAASGQRRGTAATTCGQAL